MENPLKYFAELRDPRVERNREHVLEEVPDCHRGGVERGGELERHRRLWRGQAGVAEDVSDPALGHTVARYVQPCVCGAGSAGTGKGLRGVGFLDCEADRGEVVAIDGKALCGTRETGKKAIVHMVSAWAEGNGLVLAQRKVDEKSNEITAIPKLLEALELSGTVVTIDAMGCQRSIAAKIVEKKADYILAVKENQGSLLEGIKDSFRMLAADSVAEEIDCGHGRVERRRCSVVADLSLLEKASEWPSLQGLVRIEAERYHKATGKTERETRFYITSLKPDAARLNRAIRQHWGIENKLHWMLDVGFSEDRCRKRAGHAAQNFSVLNRIALNLLKQDKSSTRGIKGKRLNAAWNHPYLLKLLGI